MKILDNIGYFIDMSDAGYSDAYVSLVLSLFAHKHTCLYFIYIYIYGYQSFFYTTFNIDDS